MQIICTTCGNPLEALATAQSTLIVCPKCSQVVQVPHDGSVHPLAFDETLPLTPPITEDQHALGHAQSTDQPEPPGQPAPIGHSAPITQQTPIGHATRIVPPESSALSQPSSYPEHSEGSSQGDLESLAPPKSLFGNYELLVEIARGGMGVVFKARQVRLDRVVALKMILGGRFASTQDVERFYTEATAAAQLQHPGIVPVFEFGEHDGCHFYSMGFVEGHSLAQRLADGPLAPLNAAGMACEIAAAVQYAHDHGVIHRDLKPGNILLDIDGSPRITDFGLAKRVEAEGSHTITGQVLGTPSFMAPEQAAGDLEQVGPLSDVYALGAMLYAMLTGHPPFRAASLAETLRQVQETEPVSPRQLNPAVDRDLETICLKCLQKEPPRRYASAQALADDLERFLKGEPIHARPVGLLERGIRWCRREPALAGLWAAVALLGLLLAGGGLAYGLQEAARREQETKLLNDALSASALAKQAAQLARTEAAEKHQALEEVKSQKAIAEQLAREKATEAEEKELARRAAVAAQERAHALAARAIYDQALTHFAAGERRRGLLWLVRALEQTPEREDELQQSIRLALGAWQDSFPRPRMMFDERRYGAASGRSAALSPDGRRVVVGLAQGRGWTIRDTTTGGVIGVPLDLGPDLPESSRLATFFSPDGLQIAMAGSGKQARLFDARTGKLLHVFDHPAIASQVAFAPVGGRLISVAERQAFLWNAETGHQIGAPLAHDAKIIAVAWGPDGQQLATADGEGTVKLWNGQSGAAVKELPKLASAVRGLAFLDQGRLLVTHTYSFGERLVGPVQTWRVATGEPIQEVGRAVYQMAAAGNTLATWSGAEVQLWTVANRAIAPLGKPKVLPYTTGELALAEPALVAVSHEAKVQLWAGDSDVPLGQPLLHTGKVWRLELSQDGKTLLTLNYDGLARVWDVAHAPRSKTLAKASPPADEDGLQAVFSPDGRYLLTPLESLKEPAGLAQLWNVSSGQPHGPPLEHPGKIRAMAFSADGKRVLMAGDKVVRTWSVDDGKLHGETTLDPPSSVGRRSGLAFSADGRSLLAYGFGLEAWDLATGKLRWKGPAKQRLDAPISLSRDGRWLAGCGYRGLKVPWLYDLERGGQRSMEIPQLRLGGTMALEFSPNGQLLAHAAHDHVQFWDVSAGRTWGPTLRHLDRISSLHWSPDGKRLLTGSWDQTAQLWDAATGESVAEFHHADRLNDAIFSPGGHLIATTDESMVTRLWDADTGEALGEALVKRGPAALAAEPALFSPTGRWLYVGGQPAQLWPVPQPIELDLRRLREWTEALTGMRLETNNSIRVLSADEWRQRRARLERLGLKIDP